jgi:hypothetical protein
VVDKSNAKIPLSAVHTLEQLLDQAPVHQDTTVSKQRAIDILSPSLHTMRSKGYSWQDIADWLTKHGLPVSKTALQGYVRRVKESAANSARGRAKRRIEGASNVARHPSSRPPVVDAVAPPAPTSTPSEAPGPKALVLPPAVRRGEQGARRSEFLPRPDSEEL